MLQSAEIMKAALIPLIQLVIVGFKMVLLSISTTKRSHISLLDQLNISKSEMQIAVYEFFSRDLEIKTEVINWKLEELQKLKRKNMKENLRTYKLFYWNSTHVIHLNLCIRLYTKNQLPGFQGVP